MKFVFDDAGSTSKSGHDCVSRAIAIATGKSYKEVCREINIIGKTEHLSKRKTGKSTARRGVFKRTVRRYIKSLGWVWTPTMFVGQGCKVHLRADELPSGRLIVQVSRHITVVIDGVLHDTQEISRDGTRCVYGYWTK